MKKFIAGIMAVVVVFIIGFWVVLLIPWGGW